MINDSNSYLYHNQLPSKSNDNIKIIVANNKNIQKND